MTKLDDEQLLVEAAKADPTRFVELYERYVDRVYAFVRCRAGNRAIAEDVTSQVFERALSELRHFEWRGVSFAAWLFRVAANALADHWRQNARESYELPDDVPDARAYEDIERRVTLFELVDRLPALQRHVIQSRFVHGNSIRDVAVQLKRSEAAVKQLQFRALERLRKEMGRHG